MQKRYIKQVKLPAIGNEGQESLLKAKVLVIGAGGLGCSVITALALAGVGELGIVDHDKVEESNLHRQPLYTAEDIGQYKAEKAARKAQQLNPGLKTTAYTRKLDEKNAAQLISRYGWIADCSDNYPTRYLINDVCVALNKTWIYGAAERWEGQVSVFNFPGTDGQRGPTYRCLYPDYPVDAPDCNDAGVMGTAPAITGQLQANEAIKCICQAGSILSGQLLTIELLAQQYHVFSFKRNEEQIQKALSAFEAQPAAMEVSPGQYAVAPQEYTLIDIRDAFEAETEGLVPGSINIPYHELLARTEELDKNKKYLLICESGKRSLLLAVHLREKKGFKEVYSLSGGFIALETTQED